MPITSGTWPPSASPAASSDDTSGAPLAVPGGFMSGHYEMVTQSGERFNAIVPAFSLDLPHQAQRVH